MDHQFIFNGITFVWNEEKARQNPIKHKGVTFDKAVEAFFDPFLVVVDASRNYEARDAIIGMDKGKAMSSQIFTDSHLVEMPRNLINKAFTPLLPVACCKSA